MPRVLEEDAVTTLILHGLPARKRLSEFLAIFEDLGFGPDCFDFVYMPCRLSRRGTEGNLGYLFINFVTPAFASAFRRAIHHHPLGRAQACEKVWCGAAHAQGKEASLALTDQTRGATLPDGTPNINYRLVRQDGEWLMI